MKLNPIYSYEYNFILNDSLNEIEQIKNFASLISDKDRFLILLPLLEQNTKQIEEKLGFSLPPKQNFYVVRAEKFKSFSLPITIEYSLLPEEMLLFLLKELLKISITHRFPDDLIREQYINSFIDYITINGNFNKTDLIKFTKNLHDESKKQHPEYKLQELDFSKQTMKEHIEKLY